MSLTALDTVPEQDWDTFRTVFGSTDGWLQGEHVGMIGPTNCGKTTLAYSILPIRGYVTALVTKPESASADRFFTQGGYKRLDKWPTRITPQQMPHRLLWPALTPKGGRVAQAQVMHDALNDIFFNSAQPSKDGRLPGNWCVFWDELKYLVNKLWLKETFDMFLLQGRELGISVVAATQRPAWVPLEMFDQSTHLFFWNERDRRNLDRISGISSMDTYLIQNTILNLRPHEFLYLNTRTAQMVRSSAPAPTDGR